MVAPSRTLLALLAAGRSARFGAADKLAAPLAGRPLALHAAETLAALPFLARVVIVGAEPRAFPGYRPVLNPAPEAGLAGSVKLAARAAQELGAAALLIALADMPRVTAGHVNRLMAAAEAPDAIIASSDGTRASPPALFAAGRFAELLRLEGDTGARALLRRATLITADPDTLIDIDTPEDLARVQGLAEA